MKKLEKSNCLEQSKKLIIECKRHHIEYDAMIENCPECTKEFEAGERIMRRFTCQLCGEFKGTTKMYCGGPIGFLCDDCKRIIDKYVELREKYDDWWKNIKERRNNSSDGK